MGKPLKINDFLLLKLKNGLLTIKKRVSAVEVRRAWVEPQGARDAKRAPSSIGFP
jgi:hypothetical protein